jgi:proteic killer suppression protein
MIKTFSDRHTLEVYTKGKSKRIAPDIIKRAIRRLEYIDHALKRDRKRQHAISINDQWRICFKFIDGDAYDVEITDYH